MYTIDCQDGGGGMQRLEQRIADAADREVDTVLERAGGRFPPVDAFAVAERLGMTVAFDAGSTVRARTKRLGGRTTILLRPDDRPERLQWSLAHEIGESRVWRIAEADESLSLDEVATPAGQPGEDAASHDRREQLANLFAARFLLPTSTFGDHVVELDADLQTLKGLYGTASHELIATRMLDLDRPRVVTVFDNGRLVRRRSNGVCGRLHPAEERVWQRCRVTGDLVRETYGELRVDCWPIHEPGWEREILITTAEDGFE